MFNDSKLLLYLTLLSGQYLENELPDVKKTYYIVCYLFW